MAWECRTLEDMKRGTAGEASRLDGDTYRTRLYYCCADQMALLWEGGPSSLAPCPSGFGSAHPGMPASEPVQQRFWSSIARGDATEVARSLVDGADANALDPVTGATALHKVAASSSSSAPKLVDMLLIAHADPHAVDSSSRTPLLVAANMGNLPVVRALLARGTQLWPSASATVRRICCSHDAPCSAHSTSALPHPPSHTNTTPSDNDAAFLAIRSTCPLAAAAAAARWPTVAALLSALPPNFRTCPHALRSLRFLIWALASHKAFPRDVIAALPPRLPPCVVNAVRPAHLASTPLVLATGNDQQQLMQWLLQQGADPELGAPLLLCAGRFCRGSRTCCVSCLLRRGARPHVAWADNPEDSPLYMAAKGDCFSHVHCLVAYGADVDGEAARVRAALYGPEPWEAHLDRLLVQYGSVVDFDRDADLLCPCGQQHARWPGSWPLEDGPDGSACEELVGAAGQRREEGDRPGVAGSEGNSCSNPEPSDDGWYRKHAAQLEQLQVRMCMGRWEGTWNVGRRRPGYSAWNTFQRLSGPRGLVPATTTDGCI